MLKKCWHRPSSPYPLAILAGSLGKRNKVEAGCCLSSEESCRIDVMFDFYRRHSQRLLRGEAAEVPAPAFIPRTSLQLERSNTGNKSNIYAAATSLGLSTVPFCCCTVTAEIVHTLALFNRMVTDSQQPLWYSHTSRLSQELVRFPGMAFHLLVLL